MERGGQVLPAPSGLMHTADAAASKYKESALLHLNKRHTAVHQSDAALFQAERQILAGRVAVGVTDKAVVKEHDGGIQGNIFKGERQSAGGFPDLIGAGKAGKMAAANDPIQTNRHTGVAGGDGILALPDLHRRLIHTTLRDQLIHRLIKDKGHGSAVHIRSGERGRGTDTLQFRRRLVGNVHAGDSGKGCLRPQGADSTGQAVVQRATGHVVGEILLLPVAVALGQGLAALRGDGSTQCGGSADEILHGGADVAFIFAFGKFVKDGVAVAVRRAQSRENGEGLTA